MSPEGQLGLWSSCSPHGEPWSALSSRQTAKGGCLLRSTSTRDLEGWGRTGQASKKPEKEADAGREAPHLPDPL